MNETIRIINRSDHRIRQMIDGEILIVPVNGEIVTSAQKGRQMLRDHPDELTDDASHKERGRYSQDEFDAIDKLPAAVLRQLAKVMMAGGKADVIAALESHLSSVK